MFSLIGFSQNVKALLDCGASLNLIHEGLVKSLGLVTHLCQPVSVAIADGRRLFHSNRVVKLKFSLACVEHQEMILVAPLGTHQMILGMPCLQRVNSLIDWAKRILS